MGSTEVGRFEQYWSEVWAGDRGTGLVHGGCFRAAYQLPGVAPVVERVTLSERAADGGRQVNCRLADTSSSSDAGVTGWWTR